GDDVDMVLLDVDLEEALVALLDRGRVLLEALVTPERVARLAHQLRGHPLAVDMQLEQRVAEVVLERQLQLLERGPRDVAPAHKTVNSHCGTPGSEGRVRGVTRADASRADRRGAGPRTRRTRRLHAAQPGAPTCIRSSRTRGPARCAA